jgi:hypothetical protein
MARYKNGRPLANFECGAFDHSATSPGAMTGDSSTRGRGVRMAGQTRRGTKKSVPAPGSKKRSQKWSI